LVEGCPIHKDTYKLLPRTIVKTGAKSVVELTSAKIKEIVVRTKVLWARTSVTVNRKKSEMV
jgi:hypothetical protein